MRLLVQSGENCPQTNNDAEPGAVGFNGVGSSQQRATTPGRRQTKQDSRETRWVAASGKHKSLPAGTNRAVRPTSSCAPDPAPANGNRLHTVNPTQCPRHTRRTQRAQSESGNPNQTELQIREQHRDGSRAETASNTQVRRRARPRSNKGSDNAKMHVLRAVAAAPSSAKRPRRPRRSGCRCKNGHKKTE
jgi:hypothetical protein